MVYLAIFHLLEGPDRLAALLPLAEAAPCAEDHVPAIGDFALVHPEVKVVAVEGLATDRASSDKY